MIENNRYFWSHLKTKNAMVRVRPSRECLSGMVFRVNNLIDLGQGRQTVVLDPVDYPDPIKPTRNKKPGAVPMRMGALDFVYASRKTPFIRNVRNLIANVYKDVRIEKIVVDVIAPGDLLVFRQEENGSTIKMVETLRVVKNHSQKNKKAEYAL